MALGVIGIGVALAAGASAQEEAAGGEGASGGAPGSTMPLTFTANLGGQASYRQRLDLTPTGGSGRSLRLGGILTWLLRNQRTDFYANATPYYEWFNGDDGTFTTYGASAGLGFNRRSTLRRSWSLQGTFEATPDQDVPPPQTEPDVIDPQARLLVPRNGYVSISLGGGSQHTLSRRLSLGLSADASSRQFNVYNVDETGEQTSQLVDHKQVGGGASLSWKSSEVSTWSGSLSASRNLLASSRDTTGQPVDENRDQVRLNVSWSTQLGPRSSLRLGSGYSALGTGGGSSDSTPTLDVAWSLSGNRMQAGLSLRRDQGIFPGTDITASGNAIAGTLGYQTGEKSNLFVNAAYAVSAAAGNDRDRTRTRNLAAGWTRRAGRVVFNMSLGYGHQNSGGGPGADVDTGRVAAGLGWSVTGRGGAR